MDKILFFSESDFGSEAFGSLLYNNFNVVGLVTNIKNRHMIDVAKLNGVNTYLFKFWDDAFLEDWINRCGADVFCFVDYAEIPDNIVQKAKKCAFNIRPSLLPMLGGSEPIRNAITGIYKETGLCAIVLNEENKGNVLANVSVEISNNEKYTTLRHKLVRYCTDLTKHVIGNVLQNEDWSMYLFKQPKTDRYGDDEFNIQYFTENFYVYDKKSVIDLVHSLNDIGMEIILDCYNNNNDFIREVKLKIYEVEDYKENPKGDLFYDVNSSILTTDGKNSIELHLISGETIQVKTLQIDNEDVMDAKTFIARHPDFKDYNFQYFKDFE